MQIAVKGIALAAGLGAACLFGVLAWSSASGAPGDANAPAPAWMMRGVDPANGPALYQGHCSGCHDHPSGRVPARSEIAANTAAFIFSTLNDGVMAPFAQGLDPRQKMEIALAISTNKSGGSVDRGGGETKPCKGSPPPLSHSELGWNGWGQNEKQSRFQPRPGLEARDVPRLKLKWAIGMNGTRNGEPIVAGDWLFTNNTAGVVYALNARTGCAFWRFNASAGTRNTISLAPRRGGGLSLYFVDQTGNLYGLDARTGRQIFKTTVDDQPAEQFTGSVAVHGGVVYVPLASAEEALADVDSYPCCRFRGAVAAMDGVTGRKLWQTFTTQPPPAPFKKNDKGVQMYGPAGGAIWSAPTIDAKRGLLYVGTGNNYTEVAHEGSDAVIAMDLKTGAIRWIRKLGAKDNYLTNCLSASVVKPGAPRTLAPGPGRTGANCPDEVGGDFDFGMSPILHTLPGGKQLLLIGQKSSQVWALDPDHEGEVVWKDRLSPGGPLGGIEFGGADDGEALYVGVSDIFVPIVPAPGVFAFRASDGKRLWSAPSPKLPCRWKNVFCDPAISMAVSAMPGVVFAGSMNGHLRAYESKTGRVIWEVDTQSPAYQTVGGRPAQGGTLDGAGPVIANGMIYVHSGYWGRQGPGGTVLLAYSVDGK